MGEGKYLVTATINTLTFKQLQSPLLLGEEIDLKYNNITNLFVVQFQNYSEIQELKKLLLNAYENNIFVFRGLEFDFSNYNRKSVECIIDQLNWIEKFIPRSQVV